MIDIENIAAAAGGNCLFVDAEKPVLVDTGMAYFGPAQVQKLRKRLGGRKLEYILLSHTHYDHAGGLPYIKAAFPNTEVVGSVRAAEILQRQGARKVIRELGEEARLQYGERDSKPLQYDENLLRVDRTVCQGDRLSLGNETAEILETKGHTNCSLSYYLKNDQTLILAESAGFYLGKGHVSAPVLTSFEDCLKSVEKCRAVGAKRLISCHYGVVDIPSSAYFDLVEKDITETRDFLLKGLKDGMEEQQLCENYIRHFWIQRPYMAQVQPLEAFRVNTVATLQLIKKEFLPSF